MLGVILNAHFTQAAIYLKVAKVIFFFFFLNLCAINTSKQSKKFCIFFLQKIIYFKTVAAELFEAT